MIFKFDDGTFRCIEMVNALVGKLAANFLGEEFLLEGWGGFNVKVHVGWLITPHIKVIPSVVEDLEKLLFCSCFYRLH